jgi:DNA-binding MarR family transcriptional regulator
MQPDHPLHTREGAAVTRFLLETFRLKAALLDVGEKLTRACGTTGARWTLLSTLQLAGQPRTVPQIARTLGLKRQGIQRLVDALARDGLVALRPNPDHARAQLVAPTPAGLALLERVNRRQAEWANRVGERVAARTLDAAASGLEALRAAVDSAPAPGGRALRRSGAAGTGAPRRSSAPPRQQRPFTAGDRR